MHALGSIDRFGEHQCPPLLPAFVVLPAWQTLWATSSCWGTRNRQSPTGSTPLVAIASHTIAKARYRIKHGHRVSVRKIKLSTIPAQQSVGVVADLASPKLRFLVPQYEADDPTGCCAATVHKPTRIVTSTNPQAATKY
jgi:hypothetical protein